MAKLKIHLGKYSEQVAAWMTEEVEFDSWGWQMIFFPPQHPDWLSHPG